ncbi:hypothetical protein SUGI_0039520 [Cryptomeria japonica]|nr:hypothetical protein SUGI_0039520 [Cryptomeria japonica]
MCCCIFASLHLYVDTITTFFAYCFSKIEPMLGHMLFAVHCKYQGMGSLLHLHTLKHPHSFEARTFHTSFHALPIFRSRKQRPGLVVAEKTNNNGENAGKQQGTNNTTSKPRRENGFWSKLRRGQVTSAQSKEEKDQTSNAFWDSFASGNGGDLEPIEPIKIGLTDLLDPDPENMLTVGLIGLLAWATAHICWQLFFVSLAIAVAALKYSFIAAVLLFILVTLL